VRRAALAALLLAGAAVAGCAARSSGSDRLEMRAPSWIVSGGGLTVQVHASGALAESRSSLVVAVDSQVVSRASLEAGQASIPIAAADLPAGRRSISVKTGSERSVVVVRVVPAAWGVATAGAAVVAAGLVWRRRRRRTVSR
jgi:hypothetical protein